MLDTILVPGQTTNCNWGDEDRKTLYITSGNSVYRIRLVAPATDVRRTDRSQPGAFMLLPNYPNPFNPATVIRFVIPRSGFVTLKVYDVPGREVATLASGVKRPGENSTVSDGSAYPSGVYLCRLEEGREVFTRKLMLVK